MTMTSTPGRTLPADPEEFRLQCRQWLADHVVGEFAELKGRGGPADEDFGFEVRDAFERLLGEHGWIGLGWPTEFGGSGASIAHQVVWAEEYTRADAPARVNHMGEHLLGPTLIEYGNEAQCQRFLPGILNGTERWCQGYSEPGAGSDLAGVSTRAELAGDHWVINGQKVWTSLAHVSHWCFAVVRSEPGSVRTRGLSFLLVPMDQPGVEVRPIVQITGGGEFNETFFTDARTDADLVVGEPGDGWRVAMGLLGLERGVSTLAQQVGFERELNDALDTARRTGANTDPTVRQRLARAVTGLRIMRWNALRSMSTDVPGPEASISKLFWASWHRDLGELLVDLDGPAAMVADNFPYDLSAHQRLFLFTRSDTIYGGSNQVQRNILAERMLGLPRDPR